MLIFFQFHMLKWVVQDFPEDILNHNHEYQLCRKIQLDSRYWMSTILLHLLASVHLVQIIIWFIPVLLLENQNYRTRWKNDKVTNCEYFEFKKFNVALIIFAIATCMAVDFCYVSCYFLFPNTKLNWMFIWVFVVFKTFPCICIISRRLGLCVSFTT